MFRPASRPVLCVNELLKPHDARRLFLVAVLVTRAAPRDLSARSEP